MTTILTAYVAPRDNQVHQTSVEVDIKPGIGIHVIGLADQTVKEALLRTITALQACGYHIPGKKIIINITPADLHKSGEGFDLPIALGILLESGQIKAVTEGAFFHGELSLDGSIRLTGCEDAIYDKFCSDNDYSLFGGKAAEGCSLSRYFGFANLQQLLETITIRRA